jgi:YHS domain-containing protein
LLRPASKSLQLTQVKQSAAGGRTLRESKGAAMNKDPVCGMAVEPSQAAGHSEVAGTTYYFCCAQCQRQFDADPRRFAAAGPQTARVPCCGFGMVRRTAQRGVA